MPPKSKSLQEKAHFRAQIIDCARALFIRDGVYAVTMRAVAKQIGYSATTLYAYFSDKEQLIRAVVDSDALALADALKASHATEDPRTALMAFGEQYVQFALTHPNHYRMMFMTAHPSCSPTCSAVEQNNPEQDAYFQLISVVTRAHQAGLFQPQWQDPTLIAQTIWAAMHGLCALEINMADDQWITWRPLPARIQSMLQLVTQGLMKEPNHA